jgi:nitroreductase
VNEGDAADPAALLRLMRSRRAVRDYVPGTVPHEHLGLVLQAGRLASSAGNNRIHRFLVIEDAARLGLVRSVAPGMLSVPAAMILICTDLGVARERQVQADRDPTLWVDVGTAAMNMQLMAHSLGLGSCPVTSFSQAGVAAMLDLGGGVRPELILMLGRRRGSELAAQARPGVRPVLADFAYAEVYGTPWV